MKLPADLQLAVDAAAKVPADRDSARRAVAMLDLTSLNDDDDEARVKALCRRAVTPAGPVAAVCIWPRFVKTARKALKGTPVRIATVVNFPAGESESAAVVEETRKAVADGAHEIDVVLPYRRFIEGRRTQPGGLLRACRDACGPNALMKVILESGAFPDADLLGWAARDAVAAGADFLKTSTGKTQPAATPEATAILLYAAGQAGRPVGVKAAGGIRDAKQAAGYLHLADDLLGEGWATPQTFRFGASSLLDSLLAELGGAPVAGTAPAGY